MIDESDIFDGFVGGGNLPQENIRPDICEAKDLVVASPLDRRVARLLTLHPQLQLRFRNNNLASLDEETKRALLQDMQDILGIAALRDE